MVEKRAGLVGVVGWSVGAAPARPGPHARGGALYLSLGSLAHASMDPSMAFGGRHRSMARLTGGDHRKTPGVCTPGRAGMLVSAVVCVSLAASLLLPSAWVGNWEVNDHPGHHRSLTASRGWTTPTDRSLRSIEPSDRSQTADRQKHNHGANLIPILIRKARSCRLPPLSPFFSRG